VRIGIPDFVTVGHAWHRVRIGIPDLVAVCKYLIAALLNACDTFCAATRPHAHGFTRADPGVLP
jgi:hypothetical protein